MKRCHVTNPLFSLVEIYKKKQNNSPLHLPLTLHLKTPTLGKRDVYLTGVSAGNGGGGVPQNQLMRSRLEKARNGQVDVQPGHGERHHPVDKHGKLEGGGWMTTDMEVGFVYVLGK